MTQPPVRRAQFAILESLAASHLALTRSEILGQISTGPIDDERRKVVGQALRSLKKAGLIETDLKQQRSRRLSTAPFRITEAGRSRLSDMVDKRTARELRAYAESLESPPPVTTDCLPLPPETC